MSRTGAITKNHFLFLKELIALEEKEENEEIQTQIVHLSPAERESRGLALLALVLKEKHFSPAGHVLATFSRETKKPLPLFSLETGDLVSLFPSRGRSGFSRAGRREYPTGTVYEKTKESITVAFHEPLPEWVEEDALYELHKSVNRVTYRRMHEALEAVLETRNTRLAVLRDISLGLEKPYVGKGEAPAKTRWFDPTLNASQREAVLKALRAKDIALVHGPPGTGKTTVLVEIIRQAVAEKKSVFVTAPSNTACDNLLERLVENGICALRLGHPARIATALREHTLDFRLALHSIGRTITRRQEEMHRLFKKEGKARQDKIAELRQEIKAMRKEVFTRVMGETEVIVGTPSGVQDKAIREKIFDLVVIDEATQATEPTTWIPLVRAKKTVMAGDHFQLPPTVRSKEAEEKGLGVTLFERYYDLLDDPSKTLLERQYRMNEKIMGFSSKIFYKNLLVADESVRRQTLADLDGVERSAQTEEPLIFIDTAGKDFVEKLEEGSESRYNPEEAALLLSELKRMLAMGVPPAGIAVISPYSAQVRLLASQSPDPRVEIDSVDGFQGREKELVMVSLVRSNMEGELGFLADTRRMNVAMTRARRKLIVIGDSATLSAIKFYKDFMRYAQDVGGYKSVWEL